MNYQWFIEKFLTKKYNNKIKIVLYNPIWGRTNNRSMNFTPQTPDLKIDFDLFRHDEFQQSFQKKRENDPSLDNQLPSERRVMIDLPKAMGDSIKSDSIILFEHTASNKLSKLKSNTIKSSNGSWTSEISIRKNPYRRTESNLGLLFEENPNQFKKSYPLIFSSIKHFISRIRNFGSLEHGTNSKIKEFDIIHDLSFFHEEKKTSRQFFFLERFPKKVREEISQKLSYLKDKCEPFHPYGLKLFWDFLNTIIIVFLLFYIPITITFNVELFDEFYQILYIIIMIFDVLIQMNTFYFQYGMEVKNRKKIIKHYFVTRFWFDFLALIGLLVELVSPVSYLALLYYLKIYSLLYVNEKLMNRFQFSYKAKGVKDLIMLFFLIVLIAHLIACAWSFISDPIFEYNKYNVTWIKENHIESREWYITYLYAYYWAIITVMTVGYGDIVPQNDYERLFALLTTLFACMVFAYSINTVGVIIQDINKDNTKFKYRFLL